MVFLNETKDPRSAECSNDLLHEPFALILADEEDLDIILANLTATPHLDSEGGNDEMRNQIPEDESESTDMAVDVQAEINHSSAFEDEPATLMPTYEESRDKAAADTALSAMMGAAHSPSEAKFLHLA